MLDLILAACLLVALPAHGLWRSWRTRGRTPGARAARYLRGIVVAGGLVVVVAIDWRIHARSAALLGLGAPVSISAIVGLGLAIFALTGLVVFSWMRGAGPNGPIGEDAAALLPQTGAEFCPFLVMSVVLGAGWELLYRGYLLWWLEPRVGMAGAILVAAAAYGVGHGFTNIRQFAGSLLAALVFTVAYAATQSLWWLMLIHVGLPLLAAAAQARKLTRESTADALST